MTKTKDTGHANQERFMALMDAHQRPLLKVCWAYGRTAHDRDDLLQEIIARLWSAFGSYDSNRKFLTWMFRVALNVAIDYRRRHGRWERENVSLNDSSSPVVAMAADDGAKQEQLRELRELLDQQSDDDRALLLLHLEGHSHREISEVLGMSESNVGTRFHRLKTALRQSVQGSADNQGDVSQCNWKKSNGNGSGSIESSISR